MRAERIVVACLAFASAHAFMGCVIPYSCESPAWRELADDVRVLDGTERVFEVTNRRGTLHVEVLFGDHDDTGWDLAAAPEAALRLARALSSLVPSAYADCAMPSAQIPVAYTSTWTGVGEEPVVLRRAEVGLGSYYKSYAEPDGSTTLEVIDERVTLEFTSTSRDARDLELVRYRDLDHIPSDVRP
jgi:hypothetical protein